MPTSSRAPGRHFSAVAGTTASSPCAGRGGGAALGLGTGGEGGGFGRAEAGRSARVQTGFVFRMGMGREGVGVIEFCCQEWWSGDGDLPRLVGPLAVPMAHFVERPRLF